MAWGTPSWVVHLPYCRTISDLPLHKTWLHWMLSSKDPLEENRWNLDACLIIALSFRQNNKCFSTICRLGVGVKSASLYVPFLRQYTGGQNYMNRVRISPWINFLRRKKHSAHGPAPHVLSAVTERGLLQASGYIWLLWYCWSPAQWSIYQGCPGGNAITQFPPD